LVLIVVFLIITKKKKIEAVGMEQDKDYQIALSTLNELLKRQQRLIDYGNRIKKTYSYNQREIESHFSSCFKALQARKDFLMSDLDNQFNDQRMIILSQFSLSHHIEFALFLQKTAFKNYKLRCKQQLKAAKISFRQE
jgi:hypothetical protein